MRPVAFILLLHLLGSFGALCLLRGRHLAFAASSGLLWGLAFHVFLALPVVVVAYAAGAPPLYREGAMAASTSGLTAAVVLLFVSRAPRWGCGLRPVLVAQAVAVSLLCALTVLSLAWNLSSMSVDSFAFVERGLAMARVHDPQYVDLSFLGAVSIFGVLLHAPTNLAGVEYLYFLMPVASGAFLATLAVATLRAVALLGRNRATGVTVTLLGVTCLFSCYFVLFCVFQIHVNWMTAMYVLLFFHGAWMALRTQNDRWFVLAAVAAFAFVLIRVEGAMFLALFLGFLALEPGAEKPRPLWPTAAMALPGMLWCLCAVWIIGDEGRIVNRTRLLLMAAALAACIVPAWCMRYPAFRSRARWVQGATLGGLALAFGAMLWLRPDHMISRSGIHLGNALFFGNWAGAWALVAALALAAPLLGRIPQQGFVVLGVAGYLLVTFMLAYFGSWRTGWFDSGNRMLMHVLPTLAWLLMLKAAAIVNVDVDGDVGERSLDERGPW